VHRVHSVPRRARQPGPTTHHLQNGPMFCSSGPPPKPEPELPFTQRSIQLGGSPPLANTSFLRLQGEISGKSNSITQVLRKLRLKCIAWA
jgi:hypothetical protein